jgi:RNA polymerase sigma-70 factor, ECF subfamily
MDELADGLPGALLSDEADAEREFSARLADSSRLAFRVAYAVLRQREDAEDVAQEAFAKAYTQFATLRDRERFRAWLARIVWRMAIDRQRANRRRLRREQSWTVTAGPDAEHIASQEELRDHLWRALDELPEALRAVTVLAAIEGRAVQEVAGLLELPEGTVKSRLFVARKRLAESLRCLVSGTKKA